MSEGISRRVVVRGLAVGAVGVLAGVVIGRVHDDAGPAGENVLVPDVAADGVTDDRNAINAALASIPDDGRHWTVHLPGMCYVGEGPVSAGFATGIVVPRGNLTLTCAPGGGIRTRSARIRLLILAGGALKNRRDPLAPADWWTAQPTMGIAASVPMGSETIQMLDPSHGLVAGDDIFIRTGQLVAGQDREPDAELNQVRAVAGARITLRHPTAKAYAQEYAVPGLTSSTPEAAVGPALPFGITKVTGTVLKDVTIKGWRVLAGGGRISENTAVHLQGVDGIRLEGSGMTFGKYGVAARYSRDVTIRRATMATPGEPGGDPVFVAPSTGCGQWLVETVRASGRVPGKFHAHEGVYDLVCRDWKQATPDGPGKPGASNISIRARAYRHDLAMEVRGFYTGPETFATKAEGDVYFRQLHLAPATAGDHAGKADLSLEGAVRIRPQGCQLPSGVTIDCSGTEAATLSGVPLDAPQCVGG